jgi:aspartate racemase
MHIGLIGGIGPAATEYYYRGLVTRHAASGHQMDLTIVHASAQTLSRHAAAGNTAAQAPIFQEFARRLAAAGAKAVAITSIGGHFCVKEFEAMSPLLVANALPEISAVIAGRGVKRVGLIGTRRVMDTRLYGGITSADVLVPDTDELALVGDTYIAMALSGRVTEPQRQMLFSAGARMRDRGADVILLAGTDLFLAFDGRDVGYPTLDCAEIHLDALHRLSVSDVAA